jgi:Acyl-CoA dehydrogenase, C-terminal domain
MAMCVSSQVTEAAAVLRSMLSDYRTAHPADGWYGEDHAGLWARLDADDWLTAADPVDGDTVGLRSLAELAEAWGSALIPLPFVETLLVRRQSAAFRAAGPTGRMATFALPAAGRRLAWPFGSSRGTERVLPGGGSEPALEAGQGEIDLFAPSLPVTMTAGSSAQVMPDIVPDALALYAATAVGSASATLQLAIAHAERREAFGQVIVKFQAMRHRLADMHRDLELARTAAYWACQPTADRIRAARLGADLARQVTEGAVQIHGGMGFTWDLGLHYNMRHIIVVRKLITGVLQADADSAATGREE